MALENKIQKMLIGEARKHRQAITVNLELLPMCNLDCKMCYIHTDASIVNSKGGLKTVAEWVDFAKELKEAGVLFLLLTGGEVFLYPEFRRLYSELSAMGFIITINTNATMIDEEVVAWLCQYPPKCVSISLYGASDESYEAICGRKGMFTRVDRAAKLLLANHIRFEFKTMLTPLNVHDADACYAYAKQFGVYYEQASYAFPASRKMIREEQIRFTAEDAARETIEINKRMSSPESFQDRFVEHLQKYENTRCNGVSDLHGFTCGATNSSCWITWQGHMTPCAMLEEPYTLPFEQGFSAAWEELKEKCDRILMSPKCSHCDKRAVCTVCSAACYAETGSFEKHSPYHCRMTEYTLESMERQVKEWGIEDRIVRRNEEK